MTDVKVPRGWTLKPYDGRKDTVVIQSPRRYMVTVDYYMRCFRGGMTVYGAKANKTGFRGRGWKQALTDAAVKWLIDSVGEEPVTP